MAKKYQPYAGRLAPLPQTVTARALLVLGAVALAVVGGLSAGAPQTQMVYVTLPPVLVVGHKEVPAAVSSSVAASDRVAPAAQKRQVVPS